MYNQNNENVFTYDVLDEYTGITIGGDEGETVTIDWGGTYYLEEEREGTSSREEFETYTLGKEDLEIDYHYMCPDNYFEGNGWWPGDEKTVRITGNIKRLIETCGENYQSCLYFDADGCDTLEVLHFGARTTSEIDFSNCLPNLREYVYVDFNEWESLTSLNISNKLLDAAALNALFASLPGSGGEIKIGGNPGAADCDRSIAEKKGWTVID